MCIGKIKYCGYLAKYTKLIQTRKQNQLIQLNIFFYIIIIEDVMIWMMMVNEYFKKLIY